MEMWRKDKNKWEDKNKITGWKKDKKENNHN